MRAAVMTRFNESWELRDVADPRPAEGQVLIRVEASGMCGTDLHVHTGKLPMVTLPFVLGHEPVGTIVEVGAGVTALRVGDRVGVSWMQKGCGRCHACQARLPGCASPQTWTNLGGGNAELMLAWAEGCTLVPAGVRSEDAAPLFCAGFTVASGFRAARPRPGERVAVLGIGGLGHLAVQYVKALGFEVVALTGSEGKRKDALAMGAHDVVVAGEHAGKALLAAGGADVIVSTTNSAAQVNQAFSGLRPEGRFVNLGAIDGPIQLTTFELMFPRRELLGGSQGERRDLVEILDMLAAGKVKPALETYPLERANEARDRLASGKVRYRAVLVLGKP
jgi:D-arabinose 1-dehydrogenase-like Zn-dependent alcohol dehydrogenase